MTAWRTHFDHETFFFEKYRLFDTCSKEKLSFTAYEWFLQVFHIFLMQHSWRRAYSFTVLVFNFLPEFIRFFKSSEFFFENACFFFEKYRLFDTWSKEKLSFTAYEWFLQVFHIFPMQHSWKRAYSFTLLVFNFLPEFIRFFKSSEFFLKMPIFFFEKFRCFFKIIRLNKNLMLPERTEWVISLSSPLFLLWQRIAFQRELSFFFHLLQLFPKKKNTFCKW